MKVLLILFTLLSLDVSAKVVTKSLKVNNYRWENEKKMYRLEIQGRSGAYFAKKENLPCLKHSLQNGPVEITFDVHTMIVQSCKTK